MMQKQFKLEDNLLSSIQLTLYMIPFCVIQGLYCDVRQFLNYVKELHGGIFRKVALSGLINVTRTEVITVEKKEPQSKKSSKIGRLELLIFNSFFAFLYVDSGSESPKHGQVISNQ